jgi:hypothetical protein
MPATACSCIVATTVKRDFAARESVAVNVALHSLTLGGQQLFPLYLRSRHNAAPPRDLLAAVAAVICCSPSPLIPDGFFLSRRISVRTINQMGVLFCTDNLPATTTDRVRAVLDTSGRSRGR